MPFGVRGSQKGFILPQDNSVQNEILKLYTINNMTPSEIAIKRKVSIRAVYKTLKKLKEKGLLQEVHKRGSQDRTTKGGGGFTGVYYRLHGLQYDIQILHTSCSFSFAVKKGNSIRLLNNTLIFYNEKLEIYQDKESSFTGNTINECFEKAISYFNDLICKIEGRYNISILKEGYHNIKIVNGHLAEVNNGMAKELQLEKQYITIYGKDGKAWFKIDHSKNIYKEAETINPISFKEDAELIFSNYMNDWRNNKPMNNSELQDMIKGLAVNQQKYSENIELHLKTLQEMRDTMKDIRDSIETKEDKAKRIKKAYQLAFGSEMW